MTISLNSASGLINSTLQSRYHHVPRPRTTSLGMLASRMHVNERRRGLFVSAADNDRLVTDTSVKGYGGAKSSIYDNQLSAVNSSSEDSPGGNSDGEESGPQTSGGSNVSTASADTKPRPKRSPLTARERLKAARVLSRNTESKVSKSEMGSKVLDAMRESDKGRKDPAFQKPLITCLMTVSEGCQRRGGLFNFQEVQNFFHCRFICSNQLNNVCNDLHCLESWCNPF
ncbi:Differentiation-associated protein [Salix suchowensis]|nr:Differentiation-associated protein [Salix suchowensis]